MEIEHSFDIDADLDLVWSTLTDIDQMAACVAGATVMETDGEEYRGVVGAQIGPIAAQYVGAAQFVRCRHDSHDFEIQAVGRDRHGNGNATATVAVVLEPLESGVRVSLRVTLMLTGKVARLAPEVVHEAWSGGFARSVENLRALLSGLGPRAR